MFNCFNSFNSVEYIDEDAFDGCPNLAKVSLPEGLRIFDMEIEIKPPIVEYRKTNKQA